MLGPVCNMHSQSVLYKEPESMLNKVRHQREQLDHFVDHRSDQDSVVRTLVEHVMQSHRVGRVVERIASLLANVVDVINPRVARGDVARPILPTWIVKSYVLRMCLIQSAAATVLLILLSS